MRYWKMLHLCFKFFPPSQRMENYIDYFIRTKVKEPRPLLWKMYEQVLKPTTKIFVREEVELYVKNVEDPNKMNFFNVHVP